MCLMCVLNNGFSGDRGPPLGWLRGLWTSQKVRERAEIIEGNGRNRKSIEMGLQINKSVDLCKTKFNQLEKALAKDVTRLFVR